MDPADGSKEINSFTNESQESQPKHLATSGAYEKHKVNYLLIKLQTFDLLIKLHEYLNKF